MPIDENNGMVVSTPKKNNLKKTYILMDSETWRFVLANACGGKVLSPCMTAWIQTPSVTNI